MGIDLKKLFGNIGKGALEMGDKFNIPVLQQADALVDAIKSSSASEPDKAALTSHVVALKTITANTAVAVPKGFLEGNRVKMLLIGIISLVLVHLGLDEATANELTQWIAGLVGAGVVGDTLRPSLKVQ